ncbi:MAG: hypothetical protein WC916_05780 [Candidatus Woesearchaeota archaeon]
MPTLEQNYPEANDALKKIEKRINTLEKDSMYIASQLEKFDTAKDTTTAEIKTELVRLHQTMTSMKAALKQDALVMVKLTGELRNCLKEEQFALIKEKIDEIAFEQFVTQQNLKKGF